MNQREVEWTISLPAAPRRVAIDPDFELFRRLEPGERPPTLAALLGSPMLTLIVPAEPAEENSSYTSLARTWAAGYAGRTSIRNDQQEWPGLDNSAVLILGSNNRFRNRLLEQLQNEVTINDERVELAGDTFSLAMGSLLLTSDRIGWLSASPLAAIPGLTRKLPHYGRYGWLWFEGSEPTIARRGSWSGNDSPLQQPLGSGGDKPLPAATPAPLH